MGKTFQSSSFLAFFLANTVALHPDFLALVTAFLDAGLLAHLATTLLFLLIRSNHSPVHQLETLSLSVNESTLLLSAGKLNSMVTLIADRYQWFLVLSGQHFLGVRLVMHLS